MKSCGIICETLRTEVRLDGGCRYEYHLSEKRSDRVASFGLPLYSITAIFTDREGNTTTEYAEDAFSNRDQAILIFEQIVDGLATPIDLCYIIEDEIG